MKKLYELTFSHMGGRTFPWASGYGPLQDMPFLDSMPPLSRKNMLQFWQVSPWPPGMNIDPGGRTWSQMIGCGLGSPNKFVSEALIRDLAEHAIPILRATEMPIAKIMAKTLLKIPAPKYYVLEAIPGIDKAWDAMGIKVDENGRPILQPPPKPYPRSKFRLSSWNGLDLFSYSNGMATTTLYCTERVRKLAEHKGWTNVEFKPLEVVD